jgi:hypothetical protein
MPPHLQKVLCIVGYEQLCEERMIKVMFMLNFVKGGNPSVLMNIQAPSITLSKMVSLWV